VDWKVFATVFGTVFMAELGDKTQLATVVFAADRNVGAWTVFTGAALALVATSALGVLAGSLLSEVLNPRYLGLAAGLAFIAIGVWTLIGALR